MDKDSIIVLAILLVALFAVFPSGQTQTIMQFEASDEIVVDNTGDFDSRITSLTVDKGDVVGSFDGVDDYITTSCSIDLSEPTSLSFWIKRNENFVSNERPFGNFNSYDNGDVLISARYDTKLRFRYGSTWIDSNPDSIEVVLADVDEWYHVVWVHDPDVSAVSRSVYRDGSLVANKVWPEAKSGISELMINHATACANVDLADVMVYNRALTSDDVSDLYAHEDVTNGLVGHWLDGSYSDTNVITDVSGNGNDGTLSGDTGVNFWVSYDDLLPVDFTNAGVTVDDERLYYSGTLGSEVTYENGIASSGTFVGEMPLIPAGTSATVTVDRCVEGQFEFVPKFAEIVYVDNVSAGDIGMSAYLVDADGIRFDDQPAQVKVSVSDANHVIYQSVQQSSSFLIPAVDAGEYNVDVQFDSWEFGGWSNTKTFSMHVLEDGGIVVNDAGITSGSSDTAGDILDNAQNIIFDLIDSVISGVMNLITSFGVGN